MLKFNVLGLSIIIDISTLINLNLSRTNKHDVTTQCVGCKHIFKGGKYLKIIVLHLSEISLPSIGKFGTFLCLQIITAYIWKIKSLIQKYIHVITCYSAIKYYLYFKILRHVYDFIIWNYKFYKVVEVSKWCFVWHLGCGQITPLDPHL